MKVSWQLFSVLLCGSVLWGCGDATDSTVTEAPAPGTTPSENTKPKVPVDPLIESIVDQFEDPNEFAEIKSAYEASPTDVDAVQSYVGTLLNLAMMHAQAGNEDLSKQSIVRAGTTLTKAEAANVEFPQGTLRPTVHYGYACVLGTDGKAAEALDHLNKAIETGFTNMPMLKSDEDLAKVRELPEYEAQLATWESHFEDVKKRNEALQVEHAKEALAKGESFPFTFELKDVYGKPLALDAYKGRVCVVDIWATWCGPCRQEVPAFVKIQQKYGEYGVQMIGLNQENGDSEEAKATLVKNFMANNSMNYPCGLITEEVLAQVPNLQGFPTTLFIDHHGNVRLKSVGFHGYTYMSTVVEELLKEQSAEARAATN